MSFPPDAANPNRELERLRSLSHLLDSAIPIPGTSYRIGIDPLLGLLPGAGDYVGAALSAYIVVQAARLGVSKATLSRMGLNIIVDTIIGNIPLLGDLFDATWKANRQNIILLEAHLNSPRSRRQVDWWFIILLLAILLLVVTATVALSIGVIRLLIQAVN